MIWKCNAIGPFPGKLLQSLTLATQMLEVNLKLLKPNPSNQITI